MIAEDKPSNDTCTPTATRLTINFQITSQSLATGYTPAKLVLRKRQATRPASVACKRAHVHRKWDSAYPVDNGAQESKGKLYCDKMFEIERKSPNFPLMKNTKNVLKS